MKINVNGRYMPCGLVQDGDRMSIVLIGEANIRDVYNAFTPSAMPNVTIVDDDGTTVVAVYENHRITGVHWGETQTQVDLQVDPLTETEATRLTARMDEQEAGAAVDEGAIEELAEIIADLSASVTALEGGN